MVDWQRAIDTSNIVYVQPKDAYPNRFGWLKDNPRIGAVICFQSQTDFALGEKCLNYIIEKKGEKHLDEAYVVLLHANGKGPPEFVNAAPAEEVAAMLRNETPRTGEYGSFWWLKSGLTKPDEMPW
jgi:hypothetical protein